jgi:hypothetical protein
MYVSFTRMYMYVFKNKIRKGTLKENTITLLKPVTKLSNRLRAADSVLEPQWKNFLAAH